MAKAENKAKDQQAPEDVQPNMTEPAAPVADAAPKPLPKGKKMIFQSGFAIPHP